jgi:hypothetical protein
VRQYCGPHVARPQEDKGGKEAEQGCVGELKERTKDGQQHWGMRVRQTKLVEVMEVSDAKVERSDEYDILSRDIGEDMEGNDHASPDNLLTHRALFDVN